MNCFCGITQLTFTYSKLTIEIIEKRCEMSSKLTITTPITFSGVFIVNFKHISHLFSSVSFVDFEQVNVS